MPRHSTSTPALLVATSLAVVACHGAAADSYNGARQQWNNNNQGPLLGGWTDAAVTPDATMALTTALRNSGRLCARAVRQVRQQVVAGMNYDFVIDGCAQPSANGWCPHGVQNNCGAFRVHVFAQPWTNTYSVQSIERR